MHITLEERLTELSIQFSKLQESYKVSQKLYTEVRKENIQLKARIIELEDKLGIDSSNSSLPTSRDIYRAEKKNKPRSHRKIGGQPGHKYNGYIKKPADVVIEVEPQEERCTCGMHLELMSEYNIQQNIEIPEIKPIVTEYHLRQKQCVGCLKKYKAKPRSKRLLGTNAMNVISVLTGYYNNSKREVKEILEQIFNLDVSLGLISNTEGRVAENLLEKY